MPGPETGPGSSQQETGQETSSRGGEVKAEIGEQKAEGSAEKIDQAAAAKIEQDKEKNQTKIEKHKGFWGLNPKFIAGKVLAGASIAGLKAGVRYGLHTAGFGGGLVGYAAAGLVGGALGFRGGFEAKRHEQYSYEKIEKDIENTLKDLGEDLELSSAINKYGLAREKLSKYKNSNLSNEQTKELIDKKYQEIEERWLESIKKSNPIELTKDMSEAEKAEKIFEREQELLEQLKNAQENYTKSEMKAHFGRFGKLWKERMWAGTKRGALGAAYSMAGYGVFNYLFEHIGSYAQEHLAFAPKEALLAKQGLATEAHNYSGGEVDPQHAIDSALGKPDLGHTLNLLKSGNIDSASTELFNHGIDADAGGIFGEHSFTQHLQELIKSDNFQALGEEAQKKVLYETMSYPDLLNHTDALNQVIENANVSNFVDLVHNNNFVQTDYITHLDQAITKDMVSNPSVAAEAIKDYASNHHLNLSKDFDLTPQTKTLLPDIFGQQREVSPAIDIKKIPVWFPLALGGGLLVEAGLFRHMARRRNMREKEARSFEKESRYLDQATKEQVVDFRDSLKKNPELVLTLISTPKGLYTEGFDRLAVDPSFVETEVEGKFPEGKFKISNLGLKYLEIEGKKIPTITFGYFGKIREDESEEIKIAEEPQTAENKNQEMTEVEESGRPEEQKAEKPIEEPIEKEPEIITPEIKNYQIEGLVGTDEINAFLHSKEFLEQGTEVDQTGAITAWLEDMADKKHFVPEGLENKPSNNLLYYEWYWDRAEEILTEIEKLNDDIKNKTEIKDEGTETQKDEGYHIKGLVSSGEIEKFVKSLKSSSKVARQTAVAHWLRRQRFEKGHKIPNFEGIKDPRDKTEYYYQWEWDKSDEILNNYKTKEENEQ